MPSASHRPATGPWFILGHAIVSDDDRIAAADGTMPPGLKNDADWRRFQAELDHADLIVVGRKGHAAHPNTPRRRRLVLTSRIRGMERVPGAVGQVFLLNPADMLIEQALDALLPLGGRVAVTGGTRVFEAFLAVGYDGFDLVRARGVRIPGGRPLFPVCEEGVRAEVVLAREGLAPAPAATLDRTAGVVLHPFRRQAAAGGSGRFLRCP
jgi:dihydrofolate reductase